MSIVATSEKVLAADAQNKASLLRLVGLWIPLIIVIVGVIGLVLGGFIVYKSRKVVTPAG
jgi:hypothetical protein